MTIKREQLWDLVLAVVLVVVTLAAPEGPDDMVGYALVVLAGGVLVVRRRWPLVTLAVVAPVTAAYLLAGYPYGPVLFSFFVAVYTAARHIPKARAAASALIALVLLMLAHLLSFDTDLPVLLAVLAVSAWVIVPFSIGLTLRVVRQAAEREAAELIRQRVDQERLRVANEVHDIVGHGLAAIRMQADVALHVLAKKPDQAPVALEVISRTSGEALEELRATLDTLRQPGSDPERSAQPLLTRVEELGKRMSGAGIHVEIEQTGEERTIPPGVALTGYRVLQESLTNVLRHGHQKTATVQLAYEPEAIAITVSNPLPATVPPVTAGGMGVAGMRKRVTSLGGEFNAGPTSDHRFEVRARIPTGESQ
jgi:signal transduction histidine kinase